MIGTNPNSETRNWAARGVPGRNGAWGGPHGNDVDRWVREGRHLRGEAIASAAFAAIGILQGWVSPKSVLKSDAVTWDEIDRNVRQGRRSRSEAIGAALSAVAGRLRAWLRAETSEAVAQAKAERTAGRLRNLETKDEPSRGLFWPRLSWVAHEGGRWLGIAGRRNRSGGDGKNQRAA